MINWVTEILLVSIGSLVIDTSNAVIENLPKPEPKSEVTTTIPMESLNSDDLYWVVAILDGDTILVSDRQREVFQVRLLAVDTKEVNGLDSTAQCYGHEAALFTTDFLKNRVVRLRPDEANQDEDPYGRKLRYVDALERDGTFVNLNEALLIEGQATFPSEYPVTNPSYFANLEQLASVNNKGLWEACTLS